MKTLLLDTEEGYLSVKDLVDKGAVIRLPITKFPDLEAAYMQVLEGKIKPDVIVLDSITALARVTRHNITIDPSELKKAGGLWENRGRVTTTKKAWGDMSDLISRMLGNLRSLPIPLVVVSHEREAIDEDTSVVVRRPDLNNMLLSDLLMNSDAICRLALASGEVTVDGKAYPARTRFLRLEPTAEIEAGNRAVVGANIPELLPEPTLQKVAKVFGELPKKLVIYGLPKIGKTVLACSLSRGDK